MALVYAHCGTTIGITPTFLDRKATSTPVINNWFFRENPTANLLDSLWEVKYLPN